MTDKNTLVLYHGQCGDGFASAWVAHRYLGDSATYLAVHYGEPPPDVTGKTCYILDFSWPRAVLLDMAKKASRLVTLDHHKSSAEDLKDFDDEEELDNCCTFTVIDQTKSGGRLAWEWFFPGIPSPWLVDMTEDRDLWKFTIPHSKAINAFLASYPFDFAIWDQFAEERQADRVVEGYAILRYQTQQVENAVKNAVEVNLDGYSVLTLNATSLISETCGALAVGRPFGLTWFRRDGLFVYSLRSDANGVDVSEIAKRHGGGGHPHSAGFSAVELLV
jgi:oligoribonuclease NrnB/cAMP/cGMP phosphodiesterase (DHH superfamily)